MLKTCEVHLTVMIEPGDSFKVWLFQYWFECKRGNHAILRPDFQTKLNYNDGEPKRGIMDGLGTAFMKCMSTEDT